MIDLTAQTVEQQPRVLNAYYGRAGEPVQAARFAPLSDRARDSSRSGCVLNFHLRGESRCCCALCGAYRATLSAFGGVPIVDSGTGCTLVHQLATVKGAAVPVHPGPCPGPAAGQAQPGGAELLRAKIASALALNKGDFFAVISGCLPTGDEAAQSVVREFRGGVPILHVKNPGSSGNAYQGYDLFFEAVIDQLLTRLPVTRKRVNLLGIVPYQHVFWKGNLEVLKELLEGIGLEVNMIFTEEHGLEALRSIPAAELNLVFSPWAGVRVARQLEERFGTPYSVIASVPVGAGDTSNLLRFLARRLRLRRSRVEKFIAQREAQTGWLTASAPELAAATRSEGCCATVADTGTAVGLTRFGANELGWRPRIVVVTDEPPEEYRPEITRALTEGLKSPVKPAVHFESDAEKIRLLLRQHPVQLVLATALEKESAKDQPNPNPLPAEVTFPIYDRLIVGRSYAGYRGGLALMEDVAFRYGGSL